MVYHKGWLTTALTWGQHLLINYLFVQNAAVNWVNTGCKLSPRSSDFFKFDIVCCQALLQVKANLCKCNNLGGYFLHRYQKPRARTNEVSSTERKNSICLARSFDINLRCKHYVLYKMDEELFCENVHADYWVLLSYFYLWLNLIYLLWFHHRQ